jgi:hypothetical protein
MMMASVRPNLSGGGAFGKGAMGLSVRDVDG